MTGKACGRTVQNSPRRLWKEPVSAAHNGGGNTPRRLWMEGGYFTAASLAQNERDRALARPVPKCPRNGPLLQRVADGIEVRAQLGAETVHGCDDRNRDSGSNQAILDGRSS